MVGNSHYCFSCESLIFFDKIALCALFFTLKQKSDKSDEEQIALHLYLKEHIHLFHPSRPNWYDSERK